MDEQDLYWLAGLLEGEGHFTLGTQRSRCPGIQIRMIDRDVIARVACFFGSKVYHRPRRFERWKDTYATSIYGKHSILFMCALYPLMGLRRKARIKDIVTHYSSNYQAEFALSSHCSRGAKLDLYWIAGLLEGEGSFLPGPPSEPNVPRIQLFMTDEDVVQFAATILGVSVYSRSRGRYKRSYQCMLRGQGAMSMMRQIYPIMGERRQKQIDTAIESYDPYISSTHNWTTKLDVFSVLNIYKRSQAGENQRVIAEEYGIHKSIVSCIKNGTLWSSITGAKRT